MSWPYNITWLNKPLSLPPCCFGEAFLVWRQTALQFPKKSGRISRKENFSLLSDPFIWWFLPKAPFPAKKKIKERNGRFKRNSAISREIERCYERKEREGDLAEKNSRFEKKEGRGGRSRYRPNGSAIESPEFELDPAFYFRIDSGNRRVVLLFSRLLWERGNGQRREGKRIIDRFLRFSLFFDRVIISPFFLSFPGEFLSEFGVCEGGTVKGLLQSRKVWPDWFEL